MSDGGFKKVLNKVRALLILEFFLKTLRFNFCIEQQ
jgi:hypothetical protein